MFIEDLAKAAVEKCQIDQNHLILVGVSGGADSLALLYGLHHLGFNLVVAHLDHALRAESSREAEFVAQTADSLGLPFVQKKIDVQQVAEEAGESLEEAARNVRYHFLLEQARQHKAQALAVAHHADDQVETVLMHFLRGAALPGLSGMAYRRVIPVYDPDIPIVRPLLGIWRSDIEAYLIEIGITACIDESNADLTYFRNRLRHQLIPSLETYNTQFRSVALRMADILGEEDTFFNELTDDAWEQCLVSQTDERVVLQASEFVRLHKALQRRVLRMGISRLRPDLRDVGYDAIERGLYFIESPSESREIDLVARLNLALVQDTVIIKTWSAELPKWGMPILPSEDFTVSVNPGEIFALDGDWILSVELIQSVTDDVLIQVREIDPKEAWLDYDSLQFPLIVRGKKVGDTWQPLGMKGHRQKVSDFYINEKIPNHLRAVWPLVISGDEIIWVAGLRPSEKFKIKADTQRILVMKISSEKSCENDT